MKTKDAQEKKWTIKPPLFFAVAFCACNSQQERFL